MGRPCIRRDALLFEATDSIGRWNSGVLDREWRGWHSGV